MDRTERAARIDRAFDVPMLVAAALVIPLLILEESDLGAPWPTIADLLNWAIWLAFLTEVVVMLRVVPNRRRWLRDHPLELAVVVLTPPFLPASLAAARLLRLLRIIRVLRLARAIRDVSPVEGLRYASVLAVLTLFGGGTAFASLEHQQSEWDGIWWAVSTMTTVGYGDVVPTTTGGRAIAIFVMLVGIGLLTLVIGAVAQRFISPEVEEIVDREVADDELLAEMRELAQRLAHLEARLASRRP